MEVKTADDTSLGMIAHPWFDADPTSNEDFDHLIRPHPEHGSS